jgi:hypothetical protein
MLGWLRLQVLSHLQKRNPKPSNLKATKPILTPSTLAWSRH